VKPSLRRPAVEAQGIEPWSECGSRTASTCVDPSLCVSPARQGIGRSGDYLLKSRLVRRRTALSQPGFSIRSTAPRAGSANRRCVKRALAQLTQPAPGYRWRLVVSKWFSQGLGPGHAAIPSSNPSKPIAPLGVSE